MQVIPDRPAARRAGAHRKRPFKPRNRAQTEERIARAALRVFAETGYERATLQELASAAGIVRGTLYQYCRSKDDVLELVLRRAKLEQDAGITPPAAEESTVAAIERIIAARVAFLQRLRQLVESFGRERVEEVIQRLEARLAPERRNSITVVEEVLQRGIERGELRPVDAGLCSRLLAGMLTPTTYREALQRGDYTPAEIAAAARSLVLHGLTRAP